MEIENKEIELTDQQFLEACKEAGLEKSLNNYTQKIGDKRVDQGIKSFQKNQDKKDLSDKERIESLETELKEMKDSKLKDDTKTLVIAELKKQNLSDKFLTYIKTDSLNDPSQITEAVKNFKEDLLNAKQAEIDQKLKNGDVPQVGEPSPSGDTLTENYAKAKNAGKIAGNPFQGKLDEGKSENKKGE